MTLSPKNVYFKSKKSGIAFFQKQNKGIVADLLTKEESNGNNNIRSRSLLKNQQQKFLISP